jgi:hypothetical protein
VSGPPAPWGPPPWQPPPPAWPQYWPPQYWQPPPAPWPPLPPVVPAAYVPGGRASADAEPPPRRLDVLVWVVAALVLVAGLVLALVLPG